jgi:hypothetical protein
MGALEIVGHLLVRMARDLFARFGLLIVGAVLLGVVGWFAGRAKARTDARVAERERVWDERESGRPPDLAAQD